MSSHVTEVTGITFVNPCVTPPVASDVVSKPLMGKLVGN